MRRRPLALVTSEMEQTRVLRAVEKGVPFQGLSTHPQEQLWWLGAPPLTGDGSSRAQSTKQPLETCGSCWTRSSQKKRTIGSTISSGNTSPTSACTAPGILTALSELSETAPGGDNNLLKNIHETFPLSLCFQV